MSGGIARTGQTGPAPRIAVLDLARTGAILGMVVFHFTFDLQMFGLIPPGTVQQPGWAWFARLVAGSFLFLVGVGLWLGHGRGIRWRPFLRRLALVAGAAALITLVTYVAVPERFIFFGILHSIAVASVLGLAFLRLPTAVTLLAALAVFAAPHALRTGAFDAPWLLWLGLSTTVPATLDFEPVFPWFGPCLLGIAAARIAAATGVLDRLATGAPPARPMRVLAWPGRHSLAIYLVHQPVLIGLLWLATRLA